MAFAVSYSSAGSRQASNSALLSQRDENQSSQVESNPCSIAPYWASRLIDAPPARFGVSDVAFIMNAKQDRDAPYLSDEGLCYSSCKL